MLDSARVSPENLHAFVLAALRAAGADDDQAGTVADNLVWNDLVGRVNHGAERLPILLERVKHGLIRCPCAPTFESLSGPIERLDGDDGFGQYVAARAMSRAVALARTHGVGVVGVKRSSFFGSGAYFTDQAARAGMVSLVLSNSFPKVAAHGGMKAVLGTNPFAFGAPRRDGRTLMIDMSTAALAGSTLREHKRTGEPLEAGMVVDAAGAPILDPAKIDEGALLPAAGAKGFGLGLLVEVLCGVLTGAGVAHGVGSMYADFDRPSDSGHIMIALDVRRWMSMDMFEARMEALAAVVGESGRDGEVRLPGEARWRAYDQNAAQGVALSPYVRNRLKDLARAYGLIAL